MARYAMVVGIARYDNFRNLDKAATDAEAIAQVLEQYGDFYKVDRLPRRWIAEQNRYEVANNKRVTADELFNTLQTLLKEADRQDVLIYFAGHGFRVANRAGKQRGFLAASDSTAEGRNAISLDDEFNTLLEQANLSSLVVLLDCCHAGAAMETDLTRRVIEPSLAAFNAPRDFYLITACRAAERSREGDTYGIFTAAVLAGLTAKNANPETGRVSVNRLFDCVYQTLQGSGQEPFQLGGGRSLMLVTYPPQGKVSSEIDESIVPYRGLEPFEKEQAAFFFGRRQVVEDIWKKLDHGNFVAVIGTSGSGKSSTVRAGLVPWLEAGGWQILKPMKPGISPLAKLAVTLEPLFQDNLKSQKRLDEFIHSHPAGLRQLAENLPDSTKFLLVVDQFEEVFTLSRADERQQFIALLTQVAEAPHPRLAIVTTMRADFLEPCLQYPALTHLLQTQAILIPLLIGADLEKAIVEPAQQLSYTFESGLLGEILQDLGQEPGCLPLLQFSLLELWKRRDQNNRQLTRSAYKEMGGVLGSLNRQAEELYQNLNEAERAWVKFNCLKLIRVGNEEKDIRQRQSKKDLLELASNFTNQEVVNTVLTILVEERLFVTGEEDGEAWVDLAHEALMNGWKRFATWRQEDRELRRLRDRIEDAFRDWEEHNQDNSFLITGGLLTQTTKRWEELKIHLSASEHDFYFFSYRYEQSKLSYEADINQFKVRLQELQSQLFERLQRESDEVRILDLKREIEDFQKRADRFSQRMRSCTIAAAWLNSAQEELVELIVQYIRANYTRSNVVENFVESPNNIQNLYQEISNYIEWIRNSLIRGEPVDQQLKLPSTLPKEIFADAFEFFQKEWISKRLSENTFFEFFRKTWLPEGFSDEINEELKRYLSFLISYLRCFDE